MTPLRRAFAASPFAAILAVTLASSCNSPRPSIQPPERVSIAAPPKGATKAADMPGLHNVVTYAPDMIGGGQPEGAEGLQTLAAMGVKTVISVDGAKPDVEGAKRLGMRYVHLPISYDTVTPERQRQLAQALASCEGPIYLHCHHGKHRSAAALATGLVVCGTLTPEEGKERMQVSGTAKDYTGLWAAVAASTPADEASLRVDPATLPAITTVSGMVGTMAEIDMVIDLVKQAQQAGWNPPTDHPDLVPAKETARMASLFANLADDPESKALPADYQAMLAQAVSQSKALDDAVRANDAKAAAELMTAINKGCKECHVAHRDR